MSQGRFVVIAGPSGVGKGTVAGFIVNNFEGFELAISATTRRPRPGEIDGLDYYFVSKSHFESLIEQDKLLEYALVHGENYYGTLRDEVEKIVNSGRDVILEIDLQGARQVKRAFPEALTVFLEPPSFEELTNRLANRGTESDSEISKRLETAKVELEAVEEFDVSFVNEEVSKCAKKVVDWVQSQK